MNDKVTLVEIERMSEILDNNNNKKKKPMLSATIDGVEGLKALKYPLIATVKYNGVRIQLDAELGPVTRTMKPIGNVELRETLTNLMNKYPELVGSDCELTVEGNGLSEAVTAVAKSTGLPYEAELNLIIFDNHTYPLRTYLDRIYGLESHAYIHDNLNIYVADNQLCINHIEAIGAYHEAVTLGYEGVVYRDMEAPYKFGRSTLREQGMMKLKPMFDAEAEIVEFIEGEHNLNEAKKDAFGRTERSSSKEGKVPSGTLGAFKVIGINGDLKGHEFKIPAAMPNDFKQMVWDCQEYYKETKYITFEYRDILSKGGPQHPTFKGFRDKKDI